MRLLFLTLPIFYAFNALGQSSYHSILLESQEPINVDNQGMLESKTRDALMSYDFIEERANYLTNKIKNITFGEYADHVLLVTPFLTGQFEFNMNDINFYYDHHGNESGLRYQLRF